jgi:hypothetical protein
MLAYVFWHWKRPTVDRERYEAAQRAFHQSLAAAPSHGFVGSWSAALTGAPWLPLGREAYEDWYLVEGSAALDPLNEAAISAPRQESHGSAAALAEGGAAGLYRLRAGHLLNRPTAAQWFAKPPGTTYATLVEELEQTLDATTYTLWMRQMVLGPTPEFCLQTLLPTTLPYPTSCSLTLRPIWP